MSKKLPLSLLLCSSILLSAPSQVQAKDAETQAKSSSKPLTIEQMQEMSQMIENPGYAGKQPVRVAISKQQLLKLMKQEGYAVSIDSDGDFLWKIDGLRTFISLGKKNNTVSFRAVSSPLKVTKEAMALVNTWNSSRRYSRSFFTKDRLVLQLDFQLVGGVTERNILGYLHLCKLSFGAWLSTVIQSGS